MAIQHINEVTGEIMGALNKSKPPPVSVSTPATCAGDGSGPYWGAREVRSRRASRLATIGQQLEPVCPACAGLGLIKDPALMDSQYPLGQLAQCPVCTNGRQKAWLNANCGLTGGEMVHQLKDWKLGNWNGDKRMQRQRAFEMMGKAVSGRTGLYTFWGDYGSGKTHALATICNELRELMVETFYSPLANVLAHLRTLVAQKEGNSTFFDRLLTVPVLALDEVTRFNATPWAQEQIFVLIDTRYRLRQSHLTLFATNDDPTVSLPPSEAVGYLFSRMREGELIELRGDLRGAVQKG